METTTNTTLAARLEALAAGTSDDPFALLGCHEETQGGAAVYTFRTMQPPARGWSHHSHSP